MSLVITSIVMLALAIIGGWPYRFYQLLRAVVCITAAFLALLARKQRKDTWLWTFVVVGVVFNPFLPLYLDRETWVPVDLVSLVLFAVAIGKLHVRRWRAPSKG